jgi:prepilin-type N-terminal cleavage/methylation domain-containing protein
MRGLGADDGFTLIELLVVVMIIGILAAIAIPIYIGVQDDAKDSTVKSDLGNIKLAIVASYTATGSSTPPPLNATLGPYGYTKSAAYNVDPDYATSPASTATTFCIVATSVTGTVIHVSSNQGPTPGACPASTSNW